MTAPVLHQVLEATGYLVKGQPAHGVYLDEDATAKCRSRDFSPDALWRSASRLTVYFKFQQDPPSDNQIAQWRREIWNQGFAPLLWVISPHKIDLYNGFGRPRETGDADANRLATFQRIEESLGQLDAFAGRIAMETGQFWQQAKARNVDRGTSVDQQLLSDLAALEGDLVALGLGRSDAQGLVGQSIFTQYVIDREIVTKQLLESKCGHRALPAILRNPPATEQLFHWLRDVFNGDMFRSEGSTAPNAEHLQRVADFLEAVDPRSGQTRLFPYQFDVIPVELISSIYEQFAHANPSSPSTNSGIDVFYTRFSLVSLVLDEISEGLTGNETVIDVTCGSGVFLVEALRRLVHLRSGGEEPTRQMIRSTLYHQIYGIDISESAVRIAAFSLYLAALELDPDPRPPEALRFEPLIDKTLIIGDALDVEINSVDQGELTQPGTPKKFDVIVGNPPWSYRGQSARFALGGHSSEDVVAPRGESLNFLSRAMHFASENTRFGLVLSAVQFFSQSKTGADALRQLMKNLSPVTLVNLSNQSNWMFPRSKMPAIVLFARHRKLRRDEITTVQVPWSPGGTRSHTFEISRSDFITLPLQDWLQHPEFLKAAFFGFRRDLSMLKRLTSRHQTLKKQLDKLDTKLCAGLKLGNRSHDAEFLHGLPFLTRTGLRPFSIAEDLYPFDAKGAERPRERNIYRAPLLLVKEFVRSNARPAVAIADQDTVFTNAFYGATFSSTQMKAASLLAAILSSSLASWFFLMTASTFGLWMRRLLLQDIIRMPVPDLDQALRSKAGESLIKLVHRLQERSPSVSDWRALDEGVFDLYNIDMADRILARDGLFRASWQWNAGRSASADAAKVSYISDYARTFQAALSVWLSAANRRCMRAEVFDLQEQAPLRVVRFVLEQRSDSLEPSSLEIVRPTGDLRDVLDRIGERLNVSLAKLMIGQRELRVYGRDEVVIIKPPARRHWMGASALEDADAVLTESISGNMV